MPLISSHGIDKLADLPLTGRTVSPNGGFGSDEERSEGCDVPGEEGGKLS